MRLISLFAIVFVVTTFYSISASGEPIVDYNYTQTDVSTGSGTVTANISLSGGPGALTFTGALPTPVITQNDTGYAVPAGAIGYITDPSGSNPGMDHGVHIGFSGTVTMSATSGGDTYTLDVPLTMVSGLPYSYDFSTFDDPSVGDVTGSTSLTGWIGDNGGGHRHTGDNRTFATGQDFQSSDASGNLGSYGNGDSLGMAAGMRDSVSGGPIFVDDLTFSGQIEANQSTLTVNGNSAAPNPNSPFSIYLDIGPENQQVQSGHIGIPDPSDSATPDNGNNGPEMTNLYVNTGSGYVYFSINDTDASGSDDGAIDWRDRGNSSNSASDLVQLGEDFIKNNSGTVRLTFEGLPEGEYEAMSFHLDPDHDQADTISVLVDNGSGFVDTGVDGDASANVGGVNNLTTQMLLDSSASFSFSADGINPVSILFDANAAGDTELPLNGLWLSFAPPAVPEPSTALLFLFGAAAFATAFLRRRRK